MARGLAISIAWIVLFGLLCNLKCHACQLTSPGTKSNPPFESDRAIESHKFPSIDREADAVARSPDVKSIGLVGLYCECNWVCHMLVISDNRTAIETDPFDDYINTRNQDVIVARILLVFVPADENASVHLVYGLIEMLLEMRELERSLDFEWCLAIFVPGKQIGSWRCADDLTVAVVDHPVTDLDQAHP